MFKNQYLFAIIFLLGSMSFSYFEKQINYEKSAKNDLELANLKGNIKSVTTQNYFRKSTIDGFEKVPLLQIPYFIDNNEYQLFNTQGNLLTQAEWNGQGDTLSKVYQMYNAHHLREKRVNYSRENSLSPYTKYSFLYFYNNNNQIIKLNHYDNNDEIENYNLIEYDSLGNEVNRMAYTIDSVLDKKYQTVYNYQTNTIEQIWSDACDKVDFYHQKFLNEDSLVTKAKAYFFHNDTFPDTTYYTFNEQGDFKLLKSHSYDNTEIYIRAFRYDDFRNIVREDVYYEIDGTEASTSIDIFEYEYDAQNNWTKKLHHANNDKTYITERTIEYY